MHSAKILGVSRLLFCEYHRLPPLELRIVNDSGGLGRLLKILPLIYLALGQPFIAYLWLNRLKVVPSLFRRVQQESIGMPHYTHVPSAFLELESGGRTCLATYSRRYLRVGLRRDLEISSLSHAAPSNDA